MFQLTQISSPILLDLFDCPKQLQCFLYLASFIIYTHSSAGPIFKQPSHVSIPAVQALSLNPTKVGPEILLSIKAFR